MDSPNGLLLTDFFPLKIDASNGFPCPPPPPIHVNSNFKSGLAQRFPSTRYFSATLTLTRFYFSQKNVPIPSILMSPELSGITKRNNIPVRLCCREHTLPYRDALPGGDHGDAPVRGTHVSTTQFGL
jgi:hypothetical protein